MRRRLSFGTAGDPLSRGPFHGCGLHPQEDNRWIWAKIGKGQKGSLPNGILYLKGGDLAEELAQTGMRWYIYDIPRFFGEEFFETKKVVYTPKK